MTLSKSFRIALFEGTPTSIERGRYFSAMFVWRVVTKTIRVQPDVTFEKMVRVFGKYLKASAFSGPIDEWASFVIYPGERNSSVAYREFRSDILEHLSRDGCICIVVHPDALELNLWLRLRRFIHLLRAKRAKLCIPSSIEVIK